MLVINYEKMPTQNDQKHLNKFIPKLSDVHLQKKTVIIIHSEKYLHCIVPIAEHHLYQCTIGINRNTWQVMALCWCHFCPSFRLKGRPKVFWLNFFYNNIKPCHWINFGNKCINKEVRSRKPNPAQVEAQ